MKGPYKKTRNYLVHTLLYSIKEAHSIMALFVRTKGIIKPDHVNMSWYNLTGQMIQEDWNGFMKFYGTVKNNYPKRKERVRQKQHLDNGGEFEDYYEYFN